MNSIKKTITWVSLFAVAMGFLETSVVIYLRELYYPSGFNFPLQPIPAFIARVEFFRELATVIMLVSCGIIAGTTKLQRFVYFIYAFAIWDLFYYVFLYIFLSWPQSLQTWDLLFLIPVPWVGPVWAPCLLSLLMIVGALLVIKRTATDASFKIKSAQMTVMITAALICIISFMWDYLVFTKGDLSIDMYKNGNFFANIAEYVPLTFNYSLFFTGFFFMCLPVIQLILNPIKK